MLSDSLRAIKNYIEQLSAIILTCLRGNHAVPETGFLKYQHPSGQKLGNVEPISVDSVQCSLSQGHGKATHGLLKAAEAPE